MSGQKQNTVQQLTRTGVVVPTAVNKRRERHQRADYKTDVRPFASGFGWALSLTIAGIMIGAAALVTLVLHATGLFAEDQTLLTVETYIATAGAAAAAYGIGFSIQLRDLKDHFVRRLYSQEQEATHYQPINPQTTPTQEPAVFLKTERTSTRMPGNIKIKTLSRYINDILTGRTTISEASAHNYKIRGLQWEALKEWGLEQGIFRWKDEGDNWMGLEIGGRAGYAAVRAIATREK